MQMKQRGAVFFIPCLLIFVQCSTYFNMFYNAKSSFDEARTLHEKLSKNFPDSIVVEPPADARTKYDRAIEKAAKVLDVFPKNKKWHDDAFFLLGESYFYEKDIIKSIRWLRRLQEEFPESPYVPESHVYLAKAYIVDENLDKAEEILKSALDRCPDLGKDENILLLLVEIDIRREGKSQAVGRIAEARSKTQSGEKKLNLLLREAELCMELQLYNQAMALLKTAPHSKKFPELEYRADRNLVSCYTSIDSLHKALKLLGEIQTRKHYAAHAKELLLTKGFIFERMNNIEEAIRVFKQVVGTADTAMIKADTSRIVGRALFELGILYQKRKGNYREAENYFRQAANRQTQDTVVTPKAHKRLQAMKNLKELRSALVVPDTSGKRPDSLYKIGELFYYELDEPDSALRQFCTMAADTATGPAFAPKALCMAAHISRYDLTDTLRSDSLYQLLIARYPGSDYIRDAREAVKSAPDMRTRKEQALEAYRTAEKKYLDGEDTKGAVQAFYNVYREYPELEIAPKALFAAAWLTDDGLQKKKVAKSLYEKICDRFPKSMYCVKEAHPRIKAVADTLEAIRRQLAGKGDSTISPVSTAQKQASDAGAPADSLTSAAIRSSNSIPADTFPKSGQQPPLPDYRKPQFYRGMPLPVSPPVDSSPAQSTPPPLPQSDN